VGAAREGGVVMCRPSRRVVARTFLWLGLGSLYALPFLTVQGAFDAFIKIDGVPGESSDAQHKEWIEIESFHHGVSQPSAGGLGSAAEGAPLIVAKTVDKASPILMLHCCNGKHIPKVELELVKQEVERPVFYKITLVDVIVSSVRPGGSTLTDVLPLEEVSFNYGQVQWDYTYVDPTAGPTTITTSWDFSSADK